MIGGEEQCTFDSGNLACIILITLIFCNLSKPPEKAKPPVREGRKAADLPNEDGRVAEEYYRYTRLFFGVKAAVNRSP